jgi:hypothetical protein
MQRRQLPWPMRLTIIISSHHIGLNMIMALRDWNAIQLPEHLPVTCSNCYQHVTIATSVHIHYNSYIPCKTFQYNMWIYHFTVPTPLPKKGKGMHCSSTIHQQTNRLLCTHHSKHRTLPSPFQLWPVTECVHRWQCSVHCGVAIVDFMST